MIEILETFGIQGTYLNIIKAHYNTSLTIINLNGEKCKVISLQSENRHGCSCFPCLFNIVLEVIVKAVRQPKEISDIQIEKFVHDMT